MNERKESVRRKHERRIAKEGSGEVKRWRERWREDKVKERRKILRGKEENGKTETKKYDDRK